MRGLALVGLLLGCGVIEDIPVDAPMAADGPPGQADGPPGPADGPPGDAPPGPDAHPCALVGDADAYVDRALGVDDASHGGGAGACAFRTIGFALSRATRVINLAEGTYTGPFPIMLTGSQGLDCDPAPAGSRALLFNAGGAGGLVTLAGDGNVVRNCILDAQSASGANCMAVTASGAMPHTVSNTEFRNCTGAGILATQSNVNVSTSSFHDSARGIHWDGASPTGTMLDNTFLNHSAFDIACNDLAAGVTGSGNANGAGPPTCDGCQNCPFN